MEKALQFLKGERFIKAARIVFIILVAVGGGIGTSFSWDFTIADTLARTAEANNSTRFMWALAILTMTMMTIPNIWALWCFRKVIAKTTQKHIKIIVGKVPPPDKNK